MNWLTYVYNLVETCNYGNSKDRIIRDHSLHWLQHPQHAKDSIVRKGEDDYYFQEVLNILQLEECYLSNTHQTSKEIDSTQSRMEPISSGTLCIV